jgi:hypothetical protein
VLLSGTAFLLAPFAKSKPQWLVQSPVISS